FFIIAVQTPGSGISILLAVGTSSTGSGNLYCQWELSPDSGNALEFNVVKHRNVIALRIFKINPSHMPRVDLVPNKQSNASIRINPITNSQRHVMIKEIVSSNMVTASSTGLVHARTRRSQPKGKSRNARVPSASKSSDIKKNVTVEDHHRTLLISKNQKTMSSEKSKRASHPPKPVLNSKQRLHLLHMDMCGPITKDETPEVITKFLKKIYVRLQALVIIVRTNNGTEFKNHVLNEYFDSVGITHEIYAEKTPQQNGVIERRNRTLVEAARTIKEDISYLYVFGALCYLKNDREDIGKLGAKAMAFEQNSSRLGLQSMTSGQISSELELTYASSTITPQRPSERDLDILFEPLHNEYLGGRPTEAPRAIPAAPLLQNLQAPTASMSIQDSAPAPTSSLNTLVSSHNVDATSQQHAQQ
nr:hypothetical protein [Tanacetum cinerariifolium]